MPQPDRVPERVSSLGEGLTLKYAGRAISNYDISLSEGVGNGAKHSLKEILFSCLGIVREFSFIEQHTPGFREYPGAGNFQRTLLLDCYSNSEKSRWLGRKGFHPLSISFSIRSRRADSKLGYSNW